MPDVPAAPPALPRAPLAYQNDSFLDSPDGRMMRILAEYQEPLARFRRERIADTVVFFGSARFRALDVAQNSLHSLEHPAESLPDTQSGEQPEGSGPGFRFAGQPASGEPSLQLLENTGSAAPAPAGEQPASAAEQARASAGEAPDAETARKLALAESAVEMARYYEEARTLARMVASWSKALPGPRHRFVVTSGGGPGIMEAANRGAWEAGAKTIGLNIKLPFEQMPNRYITPELNFEFHYFFMRKYWFAYLAKALVVFPGGFGTMDEMFELLTLAQTNKLTKRLTIVIYGSSYWKKVINLELLAEKGAIAQKDLQLFRFADTPEEAFSILREGLTHHVDHHDPHEAHEDAPKVDSPPAHPAPNPQELLGPDINKTRP